MDGLDEMLLELIEDWFCNHSVLTSEDLDNLRSEVIQDEHNMLDEDLEELDNE